MVLETVALVSPAMATMSPAWARLDRHPLEPAIGEDLGGPAGLDLVVVDVERLDRHVDLEPAALDPAGEDPAEERVAVEQHPDHPERPFGIGVRRRDVADDGVEQGRQVARADVVAEPGIAGAARGVEGREVELLVARLEGQEQLEHLVEHFGGAGVGAVDLVDDDDRPQPQRERLAGDELGLRHRPLGRVDEQDHPVDHRQDPLDLGAEIGVAGRVDDVDVGALPLDRGAFGEDGDPPLLLEVVRIHRPLLHALVVAEGAGLAEQLVDERGLAVIDVRDDGHVAEAHEIYIS